MGYKYNPYLSTQSEVVYELVKVLRLFSNDKLTNEEFEQIIASYVKDYARLIFERREDRLFFKGFPKQKLGKKRMRIIGVCLENQNVVEDFDVESAVLVAPHFVEEVSMH